MSEFYHIPVMLDETMQYLNPKPGGIYVDCTLGGGGHTREILKRVTPGGMVFGIDRDEHALKAAVANLTVYEAAFKPIHGNFRSVERLIQPFGIKQVDGILFDLGVSSPQLDDPQRGFSYSKPAPLDMRMDPTSGLSAADIVNTYSESELADIIFTYGEERWARRIAGFIANARANKKIENTAELADIIKSAIPAPARRRGPHPARRTFQALRIAVNDELDALKDGLKGAVDLLGPMGIICVITFHSLEDRVVKHFFKDMSSKCTCPPLSPVCRCNKVQLLEIITKKPVTPKAGEIEKNPRARSAKLRAARRLP